MNLLAKMRGMDPYESPQGLELQRRIQADAVIRRLRTPLLGLMILAWLHLLVVLGLFVLVAFLNFLFQAYPNGSFDAKDIDMASVGIAVVFVLSLPAALAQLLVARTCFRTESLWACRLGALFACIPILSPVIFAGIPFGIWVLVVLLLPSTAAVFDQPAAQITPPATEE